MKKIRWQIAQFFENYWWKSYLKKRSAVDYLAWKQSYWNNFLNNIALNKHQLQEPIIDIGCGPAGIFMVFNNQEITALDPLLLDYENLEVFKRANYEGVDFVAKRFENFENLKKYKTIFCLNAINHFVDIDLSFKKLQAICELEGKIIVSVDAHNFIFFRKLFAFLPLDILHPHQYNLSEYEHFLEKNGFEVQHKILMKKAFFFNYWVLVGSLSKPSLVL